MRALVRGERVAATRAATAQARVQSREARGLAAREAARKAPEAARAQVLAPRSATRERLLRCWFAANAAAAPARDELAERGRELTRATVAVAARARAHHREHPARRLERAVRAAIGSSVALVLRGCHEQQRRLPPHRLRMRVGHALQQPAPTLARRTLLETSECHAARKKCSGRRVRGRRRAPLRPRPPQAEGAARPVRRAPAPRLGRVAVRLRVTRHAVARLRFGFKKTRNSSMVSLSLFSDDSVCPSFPRQRSNPRVVVEKSRLRPRRACSRAQCVSR